MEDKKPKEATSDDYQLIYQKIKIMECSAQRAKDDARPTKYSIENFIKYLKKNWTLVKKTDEVQP